MKKKQVEYPVKVLVAKRGNFVAAWVDRDGSSFVAGTYTTHEEAVRAAMSIMGPETDFEDETGLTPDRSEHLFH